MGLRRETLKCLTLKLHVKQFGSGILGAEVARDYPPAYKRVHLHSGDVTSGVLGTRKEYLQLSSSAMVK